ncbi:hypothetical protein AYO21_06502 [Fonsecaea monophora]|uniref:Uncharacterized protein n=1 Tax=Fonsecaea monophora TaxID=254056 RepID=A0A177F4X1_9EURO|nr:hypothetical protein AYO21_06502 [Fonsecaea monophora]OAG39298.1 hypothetical protein AYO21_06502 [Fonsecaea monophora]
MATTRVSMVNTTKKTKKVMTGKTPTATGIIPVDMMRATLMVTTMNTSIKMSITRASMGAILMNTSIKMGTTRASTGVTMAMTKTSMVSKTQVTMKWDRVITMTAINSSMITATTTTLRRSSMTAATTMILISSKQVVTVATALHHPMIMLTNTKNNNHTTNKNNSSTNNHMGNSTNTRGMMTAMTRNSSSITVALNIYSVWLRLFVYLLGALAILFQALVILGDVPGAQGSGSGTSGYYLLQFNSVDGLATTRLRIGYTAMCCSLSSGPEHCAITVGKDHASSIRYLSIGTNNIYDFESLPANQTLNSVLFEVAASLQNDVFIVFPAIPGMFLALGVIMFAFYGALNKPWVGPASSWRQSQRNRRLDILRIVMIVLIGLSAIFAFAAAVSNSQMFAAVQLATSHNEQAPGIFQVTKGSAALALHWLAVIWTIGFLIGIIQTHIEISAVKIKVNPSDTAGTTGGSQFQANGSTIERASLLKDAEPMAINPAGLAPQVPNPNSTNGAGGAGGPMGARGGMRGGARGGAMGMRGRGGAMGRGRGM